MTTCVYDLVAANARLSAARTTNVYVPLTVGVPFRTPFAASVTPGGREPELTRNVYGALPPEAKIVREKATPRGRAVNVAGVKRMRAGATRMSSVRSTKAPGDAASRTRITGRYTPSVVGTPDTTWVLYEVMPVDRHEQSFDIMGDKPRYTRDQVKGLLGTDEKKLVDEYQYDLMPVREIEALDKEFADSLAACPADVWIRVKFLKPYSIDVDSNEAPAADKTLFDSAGRALPTNLRQGDKTSFEVGDFANLDPDTATPSSATQLVEITRDGVEPSVHQRAEGGCGVVARVSVRP